MTNVAGGCVAVGQEPATRIERHNLVEISQVAVVCAGCVVQPHRTDWSSERRVVVQIGGQSERSLHGASGFRHVAGERRVNARVRASAPQSIDRP